MFSQFKVYSEQCLNEYDPHSTAACLQQTVRKVLAAHFGHINPQPTSPPAYPNYTAHNFSLSFKIILASISVF